MEMNYIALGAGLAIGLSGLGAAIGEGLLGKSAVEVL
jgi:F0F1-type ATP synthase membrane subunit c/vacuolar-type H+-ATPase subunit K